MQIVARDRFLGRTISMRLSTVVHQPLEIGNLKADQRDPSRSRAEGTEWWSGGGDYPPDQRQHPRSIREMGGAPRSTSPFSDARSRVLGGATLDKGAGAQSRPRPC